MIRNNTDRFIISALSKGDEKAFDAVFLDYFPKLKNFVNGFINKEEDAENIVQDLFMNLWIRRKSLTKVDNLNAYLYTMAKNAVYHTIQSSLNHSSYSLESEMNVQDDNASVENEIYFEELLSTIQKEVERMPEKRKLIFKMSRFENMSNEEIAHKLDISKRTVETHISAALSDLKKVLYILLLIFLNKN